MLDVEIVEPSEVEKAVRIFHRDGLVVMRDALTARQLAYARSGADRVIMQQTEAIPLEQANRGYARYSFGQQIHHPEWAQLIDLQTVLPVLEAIWKSSDFHCWGAGGDYSLPGARIQKLHADITDMLLDPQGRVNVFDLPTPVIVVNFPMVNFTEINGATRFVPGTHRNRDPAPGLEEEPDWMKRSIVCGPAGGAVIRDIRCWHGGTSNRSDEIRAMTSVGYSAPWFVWLRKEHPLPRSLFDSLSARAKDLTRFIVDV